MKKKENAIDTKRRRRAKAAGTRFELKIRDKLGDEGWIVDKWSNNVDLEKEKLVKVKNLFLGPGKPLMLGAGFPDLIIFRNKGKNYDIIGVEVKMNGVLSKTEKEKCAWYLKKEIFNRILIAKKGKKRGEIKYDNFIEKYGKKYNKP